MKGKYVLESFLFYLHILPKKYKRKAPEEAFPLSSEICFKMPQYFFIVFFRGFNG